MKYHKGINPHYLTMTYDQLYYLRKLCKMFDAIHVTTENDGVLHKSTDVRIDYVIQNFRLILLAHSALPKKLQRNKFMKELQQVLEIKDENIL